MNSYAISAISAILISFLVTLFLGKILIPYLHKLKYGQKILEIGPSWHKSKEGTPTMGGITFIIGILIATAVCVPGYYLLSDFCGVNVTETPLMMVKIFAGLGAAFANGLVGMVDDFVKITKKQKAFPIMAEISRKKQTRNPEMTGKKKGRDKDESSDCR